MSRFKGIKTVGKGAHGFVQLAIDHAHGDQAVAIKYIPRCEGQVGTQCRGVKLGPCARG